ncbi:MAG: type II secretion system protein [Candidatus Nanogingivalis sp.]
MKKKSGFTVLEISVLAVFLLAIGVIFWLQKVEIAQKANDEKRKIAINAMYHNLESVFYAENGFYPKTIGENNLKAMDPNLFTDMKGIVLGEENSEYRYEPTDCDGEKCAQYTLRADLDHEDDFVKKSKN